MTLGQPSLYMTTLSMIVGASEAGGRLEKRQSVRIDAFDSEYEVKSETEWVLVRLVSW